MCVCVYVCVYTHIYTYIFIHVYIYIYVYHIFFIHSSVEGHLACFRILAIVNDVATSIEMHLSFCISIFVFFWLCIQDGIAGS